MVSTVRLFFIVENRIFTMIRKKKGGENNMKSSTHVQENLVIAKAKELATQQLANCYGDGPGYGDNSGG